MIEINGILWHIVYVPRNSGKLTRSDGSRTIGMTDGNTNTIYILNVLDGVLLENVLCHEITHAFCFSYNITMPIEEEERLCNFMRDYGREIIGVLDGVLQQIYSVA